MDSMPFEETGRYRQLGVLGRGSMGSVYRALDTSSGRTLAIKTLDTLEPDFVFGLKKEFRALAGLSHPNLVELYELVADSDRCFFTMELIEGTPFGEHLDAGPGEPAAMLRDALAQLTNALWALHAEGLLHRDIKPENVLVEAAGRVVLLDCGLVSDFLNPAGIRSLQGVLAGTPAYMSPEQSMGDLLSTASDFYSVGVMLEQALTGRLPEPAMSMGRARQGDASPPASRRDWGPEGAPRDLVALARELRSTAPADRPDAAQILERLGEPEPRSQALHRAPGTSGAPGTRRFVGRGVELATLFEAFEASHSRGTQTVCVEGTSGLGKTALVSHFLDWIADDALVLRTRCHPEEYVAFKAVDGLVDDLARFLMHEPSDEVEAMLPDNVEALVRVFPVLARVAAISKLEGRGSSGVEPTETRRRAFRALRELLHSVSQRQPLALWVDDLQWGDRDSASLLRELRDPAGSPRILFILSYRSEDRESSSALLAVLDDIGDAHESRRIELTPLDDADAQRLVEGLVQDTEASVATQAIVAEAQGSPFFVLEMAQHLVDRRTEPGVRHLNLRVADVVRERIAELPAPARRLLEIVAVAGRPIEERIVEQAGAFSDEMPHLVKLLTARMLLRPTPIGEGAGLVPFHDRVRESLIERIPDHDQASIHRRLAEALEGLPDPDPDALVQHYLEAREPKRAASMALEAAERAAQGLAFHRAASLYRRAIDLPIGDRPEWQLHAKLGEALVNAGRGSEGARSLERAAELRSAGATDTNEAMRLRRSAAEHYLRSGAHEDGLRVLRRVLDASGIRYPSSTPRALASLLFGRAQLSLPAWRLGRPGAKEREQIEVCLSAGLGLSLFDPVRAANFNVRHAVLAFRLGDPEHLARAVGSLALISAFEGGTRKARASARYELEAERIARSTNNPNVQAHRLVMSGVAAFAQWRYRDALATCDEGIALCRESCIGVTWELANLQACAVMALVNLGDFHEVWRRLPEQLRRADEDSDLYSSLFMRLGQSNAAWLARDRPEEARKHVDRVLAGFFPETYKWHVHQGVFAESQIDLYTGAFEAAHERVTKSWPEIRKSGIMRHQSLRVSMADLHARSALALAATLQDGVQRRELIRFVTRTAKQLESEPALPSSAAGFVLRAGLEALAGRTSESESLLVQAALGFDRLAMSGHASACRYWWAEGSADRGDERSRAWDRMREHGIEDPRRMAALLAPGPWVD